MIFCNVGAPEAGALTEQGLHEGPGNYASRAGHRQPAFLLSECLPRTRVGREQRRGAGARGRVETRLLGPLDQRRATAIVRSDWCFVPAQRARRAVRLVDLRCRGIFRPVSRSKWRATFRRMSHCCSIYRSRSPAGGGCRASPRRPCTIGPITGVTRAPAADAGLSPALNALVASGVVSVEPAREYLLDLFHRRRTLADSRFAPATCAASAAGTPRASGPLTRARQQ